MGRGRDERVEGGIYEPGHFAPEDGVYVIADAGSNHCGSIELALQLIHYAADAGSDAVKFQLYRLEDILRDPAKGDRKFELPPAWIPELADEAHCLEIDFLCTPFAPWAVEVLSPYVDAWKIGSFEARRQDLLDAITDEKVKIISLGMCTEEDFRYLHKNPAIFLHCVSAYPVSLSRSALYQFLRMDRTSVRGFSDHTLVWPAAAVAACALGCRTFERHLMLKDQPESPDRGPWSLTPDEFGKYVRILRETAEALKEQSWTPVAPPPGRLVHGK